jgi:hypothetical protein
MILKTICKFENHYLLTKLLNPFFYFCTMRAPRIPSFFKASNAKNFSFKPRYYDQDKERREQLTEQGRSPLKFKKNKVKSPSQKGRKYRILFLIIILSLLAYKLLIN